ncbi:carbamoyltransferase HypF [Candidatus Bathyarchaeota archaeon]|nr:MAG: carbamoyltransferase HypF [Candidatus Bathyarchaeota archaeon]
MRAEIKVTGIVQGVGFRPFVYRIAVRHDLVGYVRNRGDAGVEIVVEGEKDKIEKFIKDLKDKRPPLAKIHDLIVNFSDEKGEFKEFRILKSSENRELSGSVVPPDVAICDECLRELRDPNDKRYEYFFITCTDCGPRFTIIEQLPYDRPNTTMREFPMCDFCKGEYENPANRRFHAQTVACPVCGPKAYLTDSRGEKIEVDDPIREAGRLLVEGYILAIKGYGGFHVATATTLSEPIQRLRKVKHRRQKPFAIMARDLEAVKTFAVVGRKEAELLTSYIRPIVLLRKSENYYLSELIAPNLHNVGVMLPYTAMHYMLFDEVEEPAFVMTSANPPNQPIVKDDEQALKRLGKVVDYFLFHNRRIAHRCDDSVLRVHSDRHVCLIRRSRGYAPAPIRLKFSAKKCVLGLGGELNVASCILNGDKAFLSQHIGDVENIETLNFLEEATRHLVRLTNSHVDAIACDLHPRFNTTRLAYRLAEEWKCPVIQVQHHHAHIAALMAEYNLTEIVGIACDGYGYGPDGQAWGGEILYCDREGYRRIGHLEEQPMPGGDLATRYPLRMAAGILAKKMDISEWLISNSIYLPHGKAEAELILKQLEKGVKIKTSSCGRVLDAVAAILGICHERTYEGEPAMKLESAAIGGRDVLELKPEIKGDIIETSSMVYAVYENTGKFRVRDLAYSAQQYIAKSLAELAVEKAIELGVKHVGFSGGVACNEQITLTIQKIVEEKGLNFVFHRAVPPGDGGTSFGQTIIAALTLR